MKNFSFIVLTLILLSLISCQEDGDGITSPKLGKKLIDTTINVSLSDAEISIKEGVTVTVPQGLSTQSFDLIIRDIDNMPEPPAVMNIIKAYDVELSLGNEFEKLIKIRFDIEPGLLDGKEESDFGMGFYNVPEKKWQIFTNYEINTNENYIECQTDHLTTVGYIEFITTGGYSHKFSANDVTVYYTLGDEAPMSWQEYQPDDQDWHIPSGSENWAPVYIQDIAHYLNEAREAFAEYPYDLEITDGNINVYVTDLKGNDGEYGSVSGAVYLNNTMNLPKGISGISYQDVLKATCAHELLHLVQDNYYVMNKGKIGLWWMEATATQADWMVWGNKIPYTESEIFSIESNATLLEALSNSWDDCNKDPNWYLSGCFLHYMTHYRPGQKLNVADAVKAGGSNSASLMRVILNDLVKKELNTNLMDEYHNYVLYLFTEGNEKLSAFPFNKDYSKIETSDIAKQVKMSKKDNTQSVSVSLPYMSSKLISVSNMENSDLRISYDLKSLDDGLEAYLCEVNKNAGKFKILDDLYDGKFGDVELDARSGGNTDEFVILLINTRFTEGDQKAKVTFKTSEDFQEFSYIGFTLEGEDGNIEFSNGNTSNSWSIGFVDFYDNPEYEVLNKTFSGNKISLKFRESTDYKGSFQDYTSTVTVSGEYTSNDFTVLKLIEEITKYDEVWSDEKSGWVLHKITETKELEYNSIPFNISENDYGIVYSHIENDNSKIKSDLTKLSHTVTVEDDEGSIIDQYNLLPVKWNSLPGYFKLQMTTTE